MDITLNGDPKTLPGDTTVADLIASLGIRGPVAVSVNDQVLHKDEYASHRLAPADAVDLFTMLGGG